jgi:AraC family ethanolamine operon transcriptional activator
MITFTDFDAWGEAINGAHLRLVCDSVETPAWTLGVLDLGGVVLQVASEGGGNLCYGANTHSGPLLFLPLTHAHEHIANGEPLDDDSLLAIPRGADFSIRLRRRAHSWCSIALGPDAVIAGATLDGSRRMACRPGAVSALRGLAGSIAAALLDKPAGTAAHRAAGSELAAAARSCFAPVAPPRPAPGRPRLDRRTIIRRSMDAIDAAPLLPTAADLARQVGVNDRTLLRTFRETYGLPPKRYLMLRELHLIRRELSSGAGGSSTVADVLVRHGIWEFGRFAGRYRTHFGELPSDTLRRARASSRQPPPIGPSAAGSG